MYKFTQFSNKMIFVDLPVIPGLPDFSGFHVFVGLRARGAKPTHLPDHTYPPYVKNGENV
jgi:hypothetical protein